MKSSISLALSFLFLCFLPNPLLGAPEPLLDMFNDKVVTGTEYYIVSAITGAGGGGLNILSGRNDPCPMDVVQESSDLKPGRALLFFPFNYTGEAGTVVYDSTDLNIQFNVRPRSCNQETTVWKVDNYDDAKGEWFITTNGVIGNPGAETLQNWFKFMKVSADFDMYKIVHCPSVCKSCVKLCSDVGIHFETERRLALSHSPFRLVLIKASDAHKLRERLNAII
ncbi:hypothetical protein ACOSP7_023933 [Xanthoceras sorbifolium]|uniref:Uncharacterized protein n=1 Tax=Xanthoceras sorbifolium TaxID=99658 RepID=A0ABQ8H9L3_9ROSI|nr:hypothetical protein JRO89_XS13G0233000 [Xanthoceras sorbifolium]